MIRSLTLVLALVAAPAWAEGPGFSISGAQGTGIPGAPEFATGPACQASGPATIRFAFSDPQGIAYAAVSLGAARVRPDVDAQMKVRLWLPDYARPARAYRWRYEDTRAPLATRHTIPVRIEMVRGAGPIWTEVMAKDGSGAMTIRRLALVPDACRPR